MTIIIGSATSNNCAPFGCSVGTNWDYFQVYSATAFDGPLTFDEITFYNTVHPGFTLYGNYQISFAITSDWNANHAPALSNIEAFYDGTFGEMHPGANGGTPPNMVVLDGAQYSYDPAAGNLVMHVVVTNHPPQFAGLNAQYLNADQGGPFWQYVSGDGFAAFSQNVGLVTGFASSVPEPGTWALMVAGFIILGFLQRRKRAFVRI